MKFIFGKLTVIFIIGLLCAGFACAQVETETGIGLYEKGEYERAAESLQRAVEENKKDRQAWLYLGASLFRLKKENKAVGAFQKARSLRLPQTKNSNESFKIISKPNPTYTNDARRNQTQGIIVVAVEFGADGAINFIVPVRGLSDGLTENTVRAAQKIKFEPATKDGKPVTVIGFLEYSFAIY